VLTFIEQDGLLSSLYFMPPDLEKLLKIIENKLGWGDSISWQSRDFENLYQLILNETGVSLSTSTLRRIWGRVDYKHLPSTTTLDTLAKFAGFENWRIFIKQQKEIDIIDTNEQQKNISEAFETLNKRSTSWIKIAAVTIGIIAIGLISIFAFKKESPKIKSTDYTFSSKTLTREIPNSVVFTYDASASPADSVFIQQSWDSTKRSFVNKNMHTHTSVYYEPGFFTAKLIAGRQVVKEHSLLIPTKGWLGMIGNKPAPIYFDPAEFIDKDQLRLPASAIQQKNIPMDVQPPWVKFYNVGNFTPVPIANFSFTAEIKNEYSEGANACQLTYVILITDDASVTIPLSVKGCVSELNFRCIDHLVSGKNADLSAFGVDFSNWVQASCRSEQGKIKYYINQKPAYEFPLPNKDVHIVGLAFIFHGTGAVKKISLSNKDKEVFHAFY
jgi:hypothetical protein